MTFEGQQINVPDGIQTADFLLRPITAADAELDYLAVMETKDFLRKWESPDYPPDDFTVDANRKDMEKMVRRHTSDESYAYTVMNPGQTVCLGCVYVFPPNASWYADAKVTALGAEQWSDVSAMLSFWVRQSVMDQGFERTLVDVLIPWVDQQWNFNEFVVMTNEELVEQIATVEAAGLQKRFEATSPDSTVKDLFYR